MPASLETPAATAPFRPSLAAMAKRSSSEAGLPIWWLGISTLARMFSPTASTLLARYRLLCPGHSRDNTRAAAGNHLAYGAWKDLPGAVQEQPARLSVAEPERRHHHRGQPGILQRPCACGGPTLLPDRGILNRLPLNPMKTSFSRSRSPSRRAGSPIGLHIDPVAGGDRDHHPAGGHPGAGVAAGPNPSRKPPARVEHAHVGHGHRDGPWPIIPVTCRISVPQVAGSQYYWYDWLGPYVGMATTNSSLTSMSIYSCELRKCPGGSRAAPDYWNGGSWAFSPNDPTQGWNCWIGANYCFLGSQLYAPFYYANYGPPLSVSRIRKPADAMIFMDTLYQYVYSPVEYPFDTDVNGDGMNDSWLARYTTGVFNYARPIRLCISP